MSKKQTVYITRYALTKGIIKATAEMRPQDDGGAAYAKIGAFGFYAPREYTLTHEEAITQARLMRDKRVASMKRQITRLNQMTWRDLAEK